MDDDRDEESIQRDREVRAIRDDLNKKKREAEEKERWD